MGELLARGSSWSGRERNCCFVNLHDSSFANSSALLGLDAIDDSRAIAVTDWDQDGDLDFWVTNRTNPRTRLLMNPMATTTTSISFKLVGVTCNRDAIGAKLAITSLDNDQATKSVREVKAGDGYLSQSSKWVHFGLGTVDAVVALKVQWPDGTSDSYKNLESGARYVVTQSGSAKLHTVHGKHLELAKSESTVVYRSEELPIRLIPQSPLPLPALPVNVADGATIDVSQPATPTFVILWAGWCQPCLEELKALSASATVQKFQQAGVGLLAVNVDFLEHSRNERQNRVRQAAKQIALSIPTAAASPEFVESLDVVLRTLVTTRERLALPTSFLVDSNGQLSAVYKGQFSARQVLDDVVQLAVHGREADIETRNLAVPFAGRWFTNPAPPDLFAVPNKLLQINRTPAAAEYLKRHVAPKFEKGTIGANENLRELASQTYYELAKGFAEGRGIARNLKATEDALKIAISLSRDHWDSLGMLGSLYAQSGRDRRAVTVFRRMLQLRPNELSVANNLAWILATTADDSLIDPVTSLALAKKVCERSDYRVASALDTLSVAYAVNREFDSAIETAETALSILANEPNAATAEQIKRRIKLFRSRTAYRQ